MKDAISRRHALGLAVAAAGLTVTVDACSSSSGASAAEADVTVLVVGDRSGMFGNGTSGEGCDVPVLDPPGVQGELVEAVLDAARQTILVVAPAVMRAPAKRP